MRARLTMAGVGLALLGAVRGSPAQDLHEYAVAREASRLYIVTHKAGLLSFLGHEHAIVPETWTAELCLADPVPAGAHGALLVRTPSLVIDSDSGRALAGLGKGPGQEDVSTIQRKLLDPDHLAAEQYPEIRLEAVALGPEMGGELVARGRVAIRGITREIEVPMKIERSDASLRLSGSLRIRQRDFGIEPESIAGVVKVSNDVDLHFTLAAVPTPRLCSSAGRR